MAALVLPARWSAAPVGRAASASVTAPATPEPAPGSWLELTPPWVVDWRTHSPSLTLLLTVAAGIPQTPFLLPSDPDVHVKDLCTALSPPEVGPLLPSLRAFMSCLGCPGQSLQYLGQSQGRSRAHLLTPRPHPASVFTAPRQHSSFAGRPPDRRCHHWGQRGVCDHTQHGPQV